MQNCFLQKSVKALLAGLLLSGVALSACVHKDQQAGQEKAPATAVARGFSSENKSSVASDGPFKSASGATIAKEDYAAFKSAEKKAKKKPITQDDLRNLEEDYAKMVRSSPQFVEAWLNLGLVNERLGNKEKAEEQYQKAYGMAQTYAPACTRLASILGEKGKIKEALGILSPCLKAQETVSAKEHSNHAEAYVVQAKLKWQMGKKDETLKDLQEAVYQNPEEAGALVLRADIHRVQHEFQQAKRLYEQVLRDNSLQNPAPVLNNLALCNWDLKDYSGALSAWEKAKKADSSFAPPFEHLGQIALKNGDYVAAEKNFRRLLEITGKNPEGFVQLGVALRLQNNFKAAESEYKRALDMDGKNPAGLFNLALLYHKNLDQPDQALRFYERYKGAVSTTELPKDFQALYDDAVKKRNEKIEKEAQHANPSKAAPSAESKNKADAQAKPEAKPESKPAETSKPTEEPKANAKKSKSKKKKK